MSALLDDPWVAAEIERAVAPYARRLSAEQVAWMRAQLADTLGEDPAAGRILRAAHPRVVDQSGEVGIAVPVEGEGEGKPGVHRASGRRGKAG